MVLTEFHRLVAKVFPTRLTYLTTLFDGVYEELHVTGTDALLQFKMHHSSSSAFFNKRSTSSHVISFP